MPSSQRQHTRLRLKTKEANDVGTAYLRSISMFSFDPLLLTAIMMPMPSAIATPIKVQVVPMLASTPNFQSAARSPPNSTANPTRYMPAHFTICLLECPDSHRIRADGGTVCLLAHSALTAPAPSALAPSEAGADVFPCLLRKQQQGGG